MRYRLRTLVILMAILPPLLWFGWGRYQAWKAEQDRRAALIRSLNYVGTIYFDVAFPIQFTPAAPEETP
jgi:hypothetical protein